MNKLFSIGFRRTLKFLNTEEITTKNIDSIMMDHSIRKVGAFIYYRMPRIQVKQFIKVPCPIQNLDSISSQQLISSSKSIRATFRVDEKKICNHCPFKDKCLQAEILGEENNANAIKDLLLFSQAMHNHMNPQQIQYKVWKSGYKIMDTLLAVIQDLSQNGKDSLEFQAMRIKHLQNKQMEIEEEEEPIQYQKKKKLKEKNHPSEGVGFKNANKAMKDINPPSHHPYLEKKLQKSNFKQQASFSMEENQRLAKPKKQKPHKYSEEYFSLNQSDAEQSQHQGYGYNEEKKYKRQNLTREGKDQRKRFSKENTNRFSQENRSNQFWQENKNHKFKQNPNNQFSRENQRNQFQRQKQRNQFERQSQRNNFSKPNYSENMYERSHSQQKYSQRERHPSHNPSHHPSHHPSHKHQPKAQHQYRNNDFSEHQHYQPRTQNRNNFQYQNYKHKNAEFKNYKPRVQNNENIEYREPKKFVQSWEKAEENQMFEESIKMRKSEKVEEPRRGRRIIRK